MEYVADLVRYMDLEIECQRHVTALGFGQCRERTITQLFERVYLLATIVKDEQLDVHSICQRVP